MPWSQHQNRVAVILAACAVVIVVAALLLVRQQPDTRGMYTTHGRQVRDPRGRPFLMHGFSRPSLEWLTMGDHLSKGDVDLMASWGANTIRIPTNQDFLLEDSCHYASTYLQTLDQLVNWIIADGMNAMIDLHWSDRNEQCIGKMGQQLMADERSLLFWQRMAEHYRQNPHVFFDLYNEPHNVTWDCWLHGCVTDDGWRAVGMQQMYDTVRQADFRNLVIVGGLNWARDLRGIGRFPVKGYGIVYSTHPYYPDGSTALLNRDFGQLIDRYPIIAGEFGPFEDKTPFCSPESMRDMITHFDAPNGRTDPRIGWLAWAWFAADNVCSFPAVIRDWQGTPAPNGEPVKEALDRYGKR